MMTIFFITLRKFIMKAFSKLGLIFFVVIFSQSTINAQGTITWALTANGNAATVTGLKTYTVGVSGGISLVSSPNTYTSKGVRATGWETGSANSTTGMLNNEYFEYSIETSSTQTCVVSGISFIHESEAGNWNAAVYYSTDNFATRSVYSTLDLISVSNSPSTVTGASNIPVPSGKILKFRVYAWNTSAASKDYFNRNFQITITTPQATLPVTLSSFTAKQTTDNKVSLAWVTSSESMNKGFSIERQEEGSGKFQSLGFIASKAEGGNSQATLSYSFKDVTAKNGANMYRLVQEDLDGKKTYSEVRVVKLSAQSVSNVFPNPSNGSINISRTNDGKKMNVQVLDQSGRVISQINNITDANYRMNLPQSGIYSIKMMYPETGEQSVQRVVVQK
jgi:hypothetical protein